ncbi:hypothetical protein TOT_020000514 [Theileria orientalis strain Shintoku]|uniref:Uncharacterized protein n=1 Tax=Theileria orientalis strain Shintoku TaxID=869250 RepID=J4C866_THEOR|nr:hypothetical protein TOT_020000514 [Theileria orientalis strain Shintoku]BAM40253.1 hypothetical protein TOT_020000514 [Theileria orientalis strain Shintoku]|eukprot:XP_009690554.1 hypothetical protein TOT_020000514 [Theileria orientalis strain Shintoku]
MDYDEELKDTLQSDLFESHSSYLALLSFLILISFGLHIYTYNTANAIANLALGIALGSAYSLVLFITVFKHPKIWLSSTSKKLELVLILYDIVLSLFMFSVLNKVWKSPSNTNTDNLPTWYYNEIALNKQNIWMPFTGTYTY